MNTSVTHRVALVLQILVFFAIGHHAEGRPPRHPFIGEAPSADTMVDCDSGGRCPEGWVCVPGIGRCGVPVGQGCYDMGTEWWTGRDIPPDKQKSSVNPARVSFNVYNDGNVPIYFESSISYPALFNLYLNRGGRTYKLELPGNHFCPNLCPGQGPPMDLDCGKPPRVAQCLPPGKQLSIDWSGLEQVIMRRVCNNLPVKTCYVDRITIPGTYIIEICAYTDISGGKPDAADPDRLVGAMPTGQCKCLRVEFQHPAIAPVNIRFGK
jgi:hypothetical protein